MRVYSWSSFCIVLHRNRGNVDKIAIVCGKGGCFRSGYPWKEGKSRKSRRLEVSQDYIR